MKLNLTKNQKFFLSIAFLAIWLYIDVYST